MKAPNTREGMGLLVDIIYIGILWIFCSLPIITMGPASTAMYYSMVKSVRRGRGYPGKEFFKAFRQNFKVSLKLWLGFLLLFALWAASAYANGILEPEGFSLRSQLSFFLIFPLLYILPWVFPYVSRFENAPMDVLKSCLYLSVKNFPRAILLLIIPALFTGLAFLAPALLPLLPGFCCFAMSFVTEPVFRAISQSADSDSNEDQWYNE